MEFEFLPREIAHQHHRVGVVPPELLVLPITCEILAGRAPDPVPRALDVIRASRAMDQPERGPDRMIASQYETVARPANDRAHPAPVSLDPRRSWIVKMPAMDRTPEVGVKLEVSNSPVLAHCAEYRLKMPLGFRMRAVQRVPGAAPPPAERHLVR